MAVDPSAVPSTMERIIEVVPSDTINILPTQEGEQSSAKEIEINSPKEAVTGGKGVEFPPAAVGHKRRAEELPEEAPAEKRDMVDHTETGFAAAPFH